MLAVHNVNSSGFWCQNVSQNVATFSINMCMSRGKGRYCDCKHIKYALVLSGTRIEEQRPFVKVPVARFQTLCAQYKYLEDHLTDPDVSRTSEMPGTPEQKYWRLLGLCKYFWSNLSSVFMVQIGSDPPWAALEIAWIDLFLGLCRSLSLSWLEKIKMHDLGCEPLCGTISFGSELDLGCGVTVGSIESGLREEKNEASSRKGCTQTFPLWRLKWNVFVGFCFCFFVLL